MGRTIYHIVTAVIHRGDQVLMVGEQGPDESAPHWALPGGVVTPGELLTEALLREVREETGLRVLDPGRLLYIVYVDNVPANSVAAIFAFEVAAWEGELSPHDPDGFVQTAAFQPIARMREELTSLGVVRSCPLLSYLDGDTPAGTLWLCRCEEDGTEQMTPCPSSP